MSHTWKGKNGTVILYNPDLSQVRISLDVINVERTSQFECEVMLDGQDLLDFVADYVRGVRIARLEEIDTGEVLGISTKGGQGNE